MAILLIVAGIALALLAVGIAAKLGVILAIFGGVMLLVAAVQRRP